MRIFPTRPSDPSGRAGLDAGARRGETLGAASLATEQARLDEAREFSDPANLVLAADLRRRQEELDLRSGSPRRTLPVRLDDVIFEVQQTPVPQAPVLTAIELRAEPALESKRPVLDVGGRPSRLIIADDDPLVLSMLEGSLSCAFEVVGIAADGEYAVELARQHLPDAALVDLEMPKGGGLAAVTGIVAVSPSTAIVVLSADESDAVVRDLIRAGAMAYLRKGVPQPALMASLTGAINVKCGP